MISYPFYCFTSYVEEFASTRLMWRSQVSRWCSSPLCLKTVMLTPAARKITCNIPRPDTNTTPVWEATVDTVAMKMVFTLLYKGKLDCCVFTNSIQIFYLFLLLFFMLRGRHWLFIVLPLGGIFFPTSRTVRWWVVNGWTIPLRDTKAIFFAYRDCELMVTLSHDFVVAILWKKNSQQQQKERLVTCSECPVGFIQKRKVSLKDGSRSWRHTLVFFLMILFWVAMFTT